MKRTLLYILSVCAVVALFSLAPGCNKEAIEIVYEDPNGEPEDTTPEVEPTASIKVSRDTFYMGGNIGDFCEVILLSNMNDFSVTVDENASAWWKTEVVGKMLKVIAKVAAEIPAGDDHRFGEITVTANGTGANTASVSFKVGQGRTNTTVWLQETTFTPTADSTAKDITFTSTSEVINFNVLPIASQSWCSAELVNDKIRVIAKENTTTEVRTAKVAVMVGEAGDIATDTIYVTQAKPSPYAVGKGYYESLVAKGIIFYRSTDKTTIWVLSLTESAGIAWSIAGIGATGATSETDGAGNWTKITGMADFSATNYPSPYYCYNMGAGWRLPVKAEAEEFYKVSKSDVVGVSNAAFEKKITDLGGTAINYSGGSYWNCYESSATNAYYARPGGAGWAFNNGAKTSVARTARCVKVVTVPADE